VAADADNGSDDDLDDDGSRCRCCDADLTRLTGAARFCYKCGSPLDIDHRTGKRSLPVLSRFDDLFSTMIVRGYAHAMFRLGTRYEVRHNDHEAARCYGKASRLGSEPARVRLVQMPSEPLRETEAFDDGDAWNSRKRLGPRVDGLPPASSP
jgi:predicted amidophosphoribosyltransferase